MNKAWAPVHGNEFAQEPMPSYEEDGMIQPGRGRQILLFAMAALVCGVILLLISAGGSVSVFGWLLVAAGALFIPIGWVSNRKGQG